MDDKYIVKLDSSEILQAAMVGVLRQVQNIKRNAEYKYNSDPKNAWNMHVEGALAEYAVAKYFGVFWNGSIGNYNASDVDSMQVRQTHHKTGRLILHDDDKDEDIFILVIGNNGVYRIAGWCYGWFGKTIEFLDEPVKGRPAYFVPQKRLESVGVLSRA